jgi:glycosidase
MNGNRIRSATAAVALVALFLAPLPRALAQFATPVVDGAIADGEYGDHADGQNRKSTSTAQDWFMTWDDANLYVGITNANLFEAAVLYVDANPVTPVNGGTDADGSLVGFTYDNTGFAQLPFRADFVAYFKQDYREFRRANGANGWTDSTAFFGAYAGSGAGNVRELSIPWSAITGGGRPASFNFFGYLTSPGGYVFGQVPNENPGMEIGTSASYSRFYQVASTADGASTRPFSANLSSDPGDIQWFGLRHDTFDPYYRSPFGAVPAGTSVTLRFRTDHFDVSGVEVRVYTYDPATNTTSAPVDHPMTFLENRTEGSTLYDIWTVTFATPASPAILYYKFRVADGADVDFYSDAYADDHDNLNQGGEGAPSENEPFPAFQLTVYDAAFQTPDWLKNANVYQIFPDRFRNGDRTNDYCVPGSTTGCPVFYGNPDVVPHTTWNEAIHDPRQPGEHFNDYGNQFYGGDLKGIEDKLDYLQSLGVDTLYLTPIFKGRSNHRYDTDDYLEVDPALGGDMALASLTAEMERRGMRLILDGVFNHSSSDSVYFDRYHRYNPPPEGGCESAASPFRSWYNFFGTGPCDGSNYEAWFGFDSLPAFRDDSPEVRDFFYRAPGDNVVRHWYERGAGGWRFDVADEISHNWWRDFRPFAKAYKADGPLVGEVWPDASRFLLGEQLDSVMNYRFRKNVLGFARGAGWRDNDNNGANEIVALAPSQFDRALRAVREDYPAQATAAMLNLIDSHDTNRALYVLTQPGDSGLVEAKERLRLTALFQFTYLGAPMVYYGDEAAIDSPSVANGPNGPEDDPYNRAPYPWADESGNPDVYGPADGGMIAHYSALARLRKQHPALRTGAFETVLTGDTNAAAGDDSTYAFARVAPEEVAVVALNNGGSANTAALPVGSYFADGTLLRDALGGATYTVTGGQVTVTLAARSGVVLLAGPACPDTEAPAITGASADPAVLGPPNHKMVNVTVAYEASDNCGPVTTALSVTSNEPVDGQGDGNTSPDWEVVDEHHVRLRSERSGRGSGRVYTITITATDEAGNSSTAAVSVRVPR